MTDGGNLRTGGQILVDQLKIHGVTHVFCVPGESYLAALDAFHDARYRIESVVCRQEGGAANMAEAHGKLTGRPGICMVTRGPGATNASLGIHTARQDSSPVILFVGQVARRGQLVVGPGRHLEAHTERPQISQHRRGGHDRARIDHALADFEQRRLAFGRRVFERSRHLGELMQTGTLPAGLRDSTLEQVITLTASVPGN